MYEMICGNPPFYSKSRDKLFKLIKTAQVTYPDDISKSSIDFFSQIFVIDPKKRLGSKGAAEIKSHHFFKDVNWDDILAMKVKPPFMPRINRPDETRYVHSEFLEEVPQDSFGNNMSLNSKEDRFLEGSFDYSKLN